MKQKLGTFFEFIKKFEQNSKEQAEEIVKQALNNSQIMEQISELNSFLQEIQEKKENGKIILFKDYLISFNEGIFKTDEIKKCEPSLDIKGEKATSTVYLNIEMEDGSNHSLLIFAGEANQENIFQNINWVFPIFEKLKQNCEFICPYK